MEQCETEDEFKTSVGKLVLIRLANIENNRSMMSFNPRLGLSQGTLIMQCVTR